MQIQSVLASFAEYLQAQSEADPDKVLSSRSRAGQILNNYIQDRFDLLLLEERYKHQSPTLTMEVVSPDKMEFDWEVVAGLLDALNTPPNPLSLDQLKNEKLLKKWMQNYYDWFVNKRINSLEPISPVEPLELDWDTSF